MQPSPGRWPCLSLYLTTPQLAKNGFEIELLVLKIECFYRNYFKRLSLYFDNTTVSLKSFWNPLRAINVSLHFSTFLIRIPILGVIVTNNSCHFENAGKHLKKLNAPTEITSTGYKCNTLVCTGRRHPGLS